MSRTTHVCLALSPLAVRSHGRHRVPTVHTARSRVGTPRLWLRDARRLASLASRDEDDVVLIESQNANDERDESAARVAATPVPPRWDVAVNAETLKEIVNFGFERFGFEDDSDALNALARALNSNCDRGLETMGDVETNRRVWGANTTRPYPTKSIWDFAFEALEDVTLRVLVISGALSLVLETSIGGDDSEYSWANGAAILLAVCIIVVVECVNNNEKQRSFVNLNARSEQTNVASILRGGNRELLRKSEVVVGDVVELQAGDVAPCDGLVIESAAFLVDQSHITGESDDIEKNRQSIIFAGSKVTSGRGSILSIGVGENSSSGQIAEMINVGAEEFTPLQLQLQALAVKIGRWGISAALVVGFILTFTLVFDAIQGTGPPIEALGLDFLHIVIIAITIVVVSVPEGLPLAVTLALAFSVRRMLELSMLVRVLGSAETTGEVTALLIDKTGTVTENDQRVNRAWIAGVDIGPLTSKSVTWASEIANKTRNEPTLDPRVVKLLSILLAMNSTITYDAKGQILRGAKAEIALLRFVNSMNNDELFVATIRKYFPLVKLFPFNASRKRMCTLFTLRDGINDDEMGDVIVRAVTKGASQDVLNLCSSVMDENGAHHPLDAATKDQLSKKFLEWQDDAERVLLVAYKDIERDLITTHEATNICSRMSASDAESDLTLVAAIGMCDPLRPESTKSVRLCRRSGVAVKMVTGDSLSTATAVARRCGILDEKDMSTEATMTGEAFREAIRGEEGQEIDQSKLDAIWPNLRVLARASPQDKFILTDGIRNTKLSGRKEVVGVVGDGTNDAPALRRANVGFALGSGTECARDASDIVLLQDEFSSVVDAIRYGRNVFESIEKFITFQLTANCTTIILSTGCALVYAKSPLNAIELLFVNLVIDSLASLALATDEPSDDVMRQPPSDASNLITSTMRLNIFTQVSYQLAVMAYLLNEFGPEDTQIYCCFVLLQLANQINCRKVTTEVNVFKGATKNKLFVSLLTSEILLHVAIVQAGGAVFHTSPLNAGEWLRCTAFALGAIPLRAFFVTFFVSLFAAFREEDALHHH